MSCYKQRDMNTSMAISLFQRSNHPEISACSQTHLNARCTLLLRVGGPRFTTKLCWGFIQGKEILHEKSQEIQFDEWQGWQKWCLLIFKFLGEWDTGYWYMSFAHFDVSFLGKSITHTHTYTPCRLIALQENYLTRFLKRSPQSLLSWSCSLAGCAIQKVFKLNLSFRLCYGFGMGPSLTLQVGIALSVFYWQKNSATWELRKQHLSKSSKVEICPKAWRGHMVNVLGPWWIFSGSFRMYPTDGSQIQPMDLNGPWCFIRHGWRKILLDILQNPPRLCNIETSKWEDVYNLFFSMVLL